MGKTKQAGVVPVEHITHSILVLRGHRVLLDTELAVLYGVSTKRFNEQVRRNRERFPADFMFQLTDEEHAALRSQIATSNASAVPGRGGRRYLPYAFTEHGAIMAATILNSSRAVEMSKPLIDARRHELKVTLPDDSVIVDGNIDMARIRPIARLGYMDYTSVDNIFTMHRVPVR